MILAGLTRYRRPIFQVALAAADAASACLALALAVAARGWLQLPDPAAGAAADGVPAFRCLMLSALVVSVYAGMGLYEIRRGWSGTQLAVSSAVGALVATALFLTGCYMVQDHSVSRLVISALVLQTAGSSVLVRLGARETVRWCRRRGLGVKRVVIVGDGGLAAALRRRIEENPCAGLVVCGQAIPRETLPQSDATVSGGSIEDVAAEILRLAPHRVLFAAGIVEHEELQHLTEVCLAHDIETLQVPRLYRSYPGQVTARELLGMPFLGLGNHDLDGWELVIKNLADRLLAAAALLALSPLLGALAVAVRWSTGGPVLRRARRAGRGGVPFTLLCFENCRVEDHRRVTTPVGAVMERLSLRQLPQLLNVLAGDMSLVGPTPDTPEGLTRLSGWQRTRLSVKPGITGLAQLKDRNGWPDAAGMIRDDLVYIDTQSLLLDAKILLAAAARAVGGAWRVAAPARPAAPREAGP